MLDYVIGTFGSINLELSIGSIQYRDLRLNTNFIPELDRKKNRMEKVDLERAGEPKQVVNTLSNYPGFILYDICVSDFIPGLM